MNMTSDTTRAAAATGLRVAAACFLIAFSMAPAAAAQEPRESGKIVLDIPIRQSGGVDIAKSSVTIAVGGMKKSKSGAT